MAKFTIVQPGERIVFSAQDLVDAERREMLNAAERDSVLARYFPRTDEHLELFELALPPNAEVSPHAHDLDEVIYVLSGSLSSGAHTLGPGAALYVEAHTLYGFRSGPEGCSLLNFRPRAGAGYMTKAEVVANRKVSRARPEVD